MVEIDRILNALKVTVKLSSLQHKFKYTDFDIFQYICSVFKI
jgi:hypothetical protein